MFALQQHRSIASLVSIVVHAGVVAVAIAGAERVAPAAPPIVILPESLLVVPNTPAPGVIAPVAGPVINPVSVPAIPDLPAVPEIPGATGTRFPSPAPGGALPAGSVAGDPDIWDPTVTDEPPMLLSAPVPAYPPLLRQAGIQGWVTVLAVVDSMGRAEVASLRVVNSPNPGFDRPALECLRRALFRPGRVHGRAVRVLVSVPLHFTLRP